ncbi:hypothetical protein HZB58_04495 [Candidatus Gottesmanbacteria bacterium]|nr:hypothetical protein [Candidatus Gottesmanbacteria bacterium]
MKNQEYQPSFSFSPQRNPRAEKIPITFVTSSDGHNKAEVFQKWLPDWQIGHREPLFNEEKIHETAPRDEHRPQVIAEHKAKDDVTLALAISGAANAIVENGDLYTLGEEKMLLYTDTVQLVHVSDNEIAILEKPVGDPVEWAMHSPEAMIQSGKDIEIINALTGVRVSKNGVSEPATVILHVKATMRPFTREEIVAYAKKPGNTVSQTSGGISMANGARSFLDMDKPLIIGLADSMDEEPTELLRYETWHDVPSADLKPFICGAVEPAIERLTQKTKATAPARV